MAISGYPSSPDSGGGLPETPLSIPHGGTGATSSAASPFALKGVNTDLTQINQADILSQSFESFTGAGTFTATGTKALVLIDGGTAATLRMPAHSSGQKTILTIANTSSGTGGVTLVTQGSDVFGFENNVFLASTVLGVGQRITLQAFDGALVGFPGITAWEVLSPPTAQVNRLTSATTQSPSLNTGSMEYTSATGCAVTLPTVINRPSFWMSFRNSSPTGNVVLTPAATQFIIDSTGSAGASYTVPPNSCVLMGTTLDGVDGWRVLSESIAILPISRGGTGNTVGTAAKLVSTVANTITLSSNVVAETVTLSSGQTADAINVNSFGNTGGDKFKVESNGNTSCNNLSLNSFSVTGLSTYTLTASSPYHILVDSSASNVDIYLPAGSAGKAFLIEKVSPDTNTVTIHSDAGSPTQYVLAQFYTSTMLVRQLQAVELRFGSGFIGDMWYGVKDAIPLMAGYDVLAGDPNGNLIPISKSSAASGLKSLVQVSFGNFTYYPVPVGSLIKANANTFNLNVDQDPYLLYVGSSATATINVNLPAINDGTALNKAWAIQRYLSGGYDVIVNTAAGDTFSDGSTAITLTSELDVLDIQSSERVDIPVWHIKSRISAINPGITYKSGSNARVGSGTLVAGTVAVANTSVTANSKVFLQRTGTGSSVVGTLTVTSKTAGVGFTVTSETALGAVSADTGTFDYFIQEVV